MESGFQRLFLIALLVSLPLTGYTQEDESDEPTIDEIIGSGLERRKIKESEIDSEDFEFGVFAGVMNVEDFGSNPVKGARIAFHINEYFFLEAAGGKTTTDETSFERLSGAIRLIDDRDLTYYNLSIGYNFLPGEVFLTKNLTLNSNFYIIGGVGNTDFGGEERLTYNAGAGLRLFLTDWMAFHVDVRSHIFDSDIFGTDETTQNLETHAGFTFFF